MSTELVGRGIQLAGTIASFTPGVSQAYWAIRAGVVIGTQLLGGYIRSRGASDAASIERGVTANISSNEAALPVIYGRTKIGITLMDIRVNTASDNDEELYVVGALCIGSEDGTGIQAVDEVYLDDVLAIDGPIFTNAPRDDEVTTAFQVEELIGMPLVIGNVKKVAYGLHAGSDTQAVDTDLNSTFGEYGANDAGRGVAYLVLRLSHTEELFSGIPNVTAIVQGQKVYDPRTSTWGWSENSALCVLDYLTSKRYGCGALYSERDGGSRSEIDEQSFIDAANYCEETVSTPAGNQDRFTCNGRLDTGKSKERNLQELLSSCRGELVYQGGKFRLQIRQPTTAQVREITDDDIAGDIEYWRGGTETAGNRVVAQFVDADNGWYPQEVSWPDATQTNGFLTNDSGFENQLELVLPFTDDLYRAQQIGMVALRESREDKGISLPLKEVALQYQVGEVVNVRHPRGGFDPQAFWIRAMVLNEDNTIQALLTEYDAAAYTLETLNTRDTLSGDGLPDSNTVQPPTGVAFVADNTTALETQSGQYQPRGSLTWTRSVHTFLEYYEVQFKLNSEGLAAWRSAAPDPLKGDTQVYILGVTNGVSIDIRIRAVNGLGRKSSWVTLTNQSISTQSSTYGSPDLADTLISGLQNGHFLIWNGSAWVNDFIEDADIDSQVASILGALAPATGSDFLDWGGTGSSFMRKITDQGGLGIGADSSIVILAGDTLPAYLTGVGIVPASTGETLHLAADGDVWINPNQQSAYNTGARFRFVAAGQALGPDGSAGNPTWSFESDQNKGLYSISSTKLGFSVDGAARASLDNVGALRVLGDVISNATP